jgi:Ras GTPase-activating-like protein IQGAP2/3
VLEEEFRLAKSASNLLRANSALTRMMTTYTRRGPGQQYLKKTLTAVLTEITSQSDLILEVNPLKVYEAMINQEEARSGQLSTLNRKPTAEEAAANASVQAIIAPRIKQLTEIADRFISAFIDSIDDVPYGIRWICKQIRQLTKSRAVGVSLFVWLFVCPCVYVCGCVCIYIYLCVCVCVCVCVQTSVSIYIYICVCVCIPVVVP